MESQTKKLDFRCGFATNYTISIENKTASFKEELIKKDVFVGNLIEINAKQGEKVCIEKYVGVTSSLNYPPSQLV